MPSPGEIGEKLYQEIWKIRNNDAGASVVGVLGGQGSVKTTACLDIVEKKFKHHRDEKVFWHETIGSPMQCNRIIGHPIKILIEEGMNIQFINVTRKELISPQITFFKGFEELYSKAEYKTLNVVFFDYKKKWTSFMGFLSNDVNAGGDWQTIVFDELETIYPADVNNHTRDKWWDWTVKDSTDVIKELRKSRVGFVGNYHSKDAIYHSIRNKLMYRMYGFGSRPEGRVSQRAIDQLQMGEFWIEKEYTVFGKIKIKKYHPENQEVWTTKLLM